MDIFLVRHAIAVPRGGDALDHARPLTPKGRTRFEKEVQGLYGLGVRFDRIYHSPWTRAVQTAELLKPLLSGERTQTAGLVRTPDPGLLSELDGESIALVGHEPWMGELLSLLLLGTLEESHRFPLKKGGIAHLDGEPRPAGCTLLALYPPRPLRRLSG